MNTLASYEESQETCEVSTIQFGNDCWTGKPWKSIYPIILLFEISKQLYSIVCHTSRLLFKLVIQLCDLLFNCLFILFVSVEIITIFAITGHFGLVWLVGCMLDGDLIIDMIDYYSCKLQV